jgi:hypothetical protein
MDLLLTKTLTAATPHTRLQKTATANQLQLQLQLQQQHTNWH